jgi:hypothetical protein
MSRATPAAAMAPMRQVTTDKGMAGFNASGVRGVLGALERLGQGQ